MLHCGATDEDEPTEESRWAAWAEDRDTGPLHAKRMETVDDEILEQAVDFINRKQGEGRPWFTWFNTTHMHL